MKFTRDAANMLVDAMVNYSRHSLQTYARLRIDANHCENAWNDQLTKDYFEVLSSLDSTMGISFNRLVEYKNNLVVKIKEI
jgi:hypothetical protein